MPVEIALLAMPYLDPGRGRVEMTAPPGITVAEAVARALPGATEHQRRDAVVRINGHIIDPAHWHRIRPKPGTTVTVRIVPRGGNLRAVLLIAVTIAAIALGQYYAVGLGSLVFAGGAATVLTAGQIAVSQAIISTTVLVAGNLLINALVPLRRPDSPGKASPTYTIQGLQNVADPNGVVPTILGTVRHASRYAAPPYTEAIDNERYVTVLFVLGYGPLDISDAKIGESPVEKFQDVVVEYREGWPDDPPITLYPEQVIEDNLAIHLTNAGGPVSRYTAADADDISIDLTWPQGLQGFTNQGKQEPVTIELRVRYRLVGAEPWTTLDPIKVTEKTSDTFWRTTRWHVPTRGRYEVEVARITQDFDNIANQIAHRVDWTALRTFRPEYPINFDKPLALAAVRIRATDQLSGVLDQFNVVLKSIVWDWDSGLGYWVQRTSNNPASLYRHIHQGPANSYPTPDSGLDLAGLADWHDFCVAKGLEYNYVHDSEQSIYQAMAQVAAVGRATPHDQGDRWGVVIDRIRTVSTNDVTPRNSWEFKGERTYLQHPDGFRVQFQDETQGYINAERVVPWPGTAEADVRITEELPLPGITNPDLIWKEARRRQYEIIHRPDRYFATQDFEQFAETRGDLVRLNHDVLLRTQVAGRVIAISGGVLTLDDHVTMEAGESYGVRFRRDDGASLLRSVTTAPGRTRSIMLAGAGDLPEVGNLCSFGPAGHESRECIVHGIETGDNLSARLTLIDHAPQIETLTDAEVPPAWDGRVGQPVDPWTGAPEVPEIVDIASSESALQPWLEEEPTVDVVVTLRPGAGNVVPIGAYEVRHRIVGAPGWTVIEDISPAAASARISAVYEVGDEIEAQARAMSVRDLFSDWSASSFHTVGESDDWVAEIAEFDAELKPSGLWRYTWSIADVPTGREAADIAGFQVAAAAGSWDEWDDLTVLHSGYLSVSPWDFSVPDADPAEDELFTFAIRAVTDDGRFGEPFFIYRLSSGEMLVVEDGIPVIDHDGVYAVEPA